MVRPGGNHVNRSPVAQILVERVFGPGERTVALPFNLLSAVAASTVDSAADAIFPAREAQVEVESCAGVGNVISYAGVFRWICDVGWMRGDGRRNEREDPELTGGEVASSFVKSGEDALCEKALDQDQKTETRRAKHDRINWTETAR